MYGKEFHSLESWNLQPPMPRPNTFSVKYTTCSAIPAPHSSCIPKFPLSPLNQHLVGISSDQQNKTDINTETIVSSRWNPTPEQLEALEEMYRGGTTTPSSEQIQQIAENLRRFGKIEGKNVFYWFQNHKSRRRQKRRRHFESSRGKPLRDDIVNFQTKESGLSSTGIQVEETKNWETPSNCSTLSQEYVSIQGQVAAENKLHDRIQFEEREFHKRNNNRIAKHATWQVVELPSSTAPMASALNRASFINQDDEIENSQTLELFPLWHEDHDDANILKNDDEMTMTNMITNFTPIQFFEFLPIKN